MSKTKTVFIWIVRLVAALIMLQTLFYKFSGAPESVYIFSTLGMEPWGRIGTGIVELFAAVLLLLPKTTWLGALIGVAIMSGAILSHLTKLGIEVADDGGQLFIYGLITWVCCASLLWIERGRVQSMVKLTIPK